MYREPAVKCTVPFICVRSHICPRHPWAARAVSCREVIKRLVAYQLHRNLTSPWVSPGYPHCVIPRSLKREKGLWLGRSIIIPVAFIAVPEAIRYLQANSSRSDPQNEQTK